jgi:serine/threonine protein kinase
MRWLAGGTLERRLDDEPLSVDETMTLVRQIGGALSTAHRHGVVHRDVKTANILFDEHGNAFLGDPLPDAAEPAQSSWAGSVAGSVCQALMQRRRKVSMTTSPFFSRKWPCALKIEPASLRHVSFNEPLALLPLNTTASRP